MEGENVGGQKAGGQHGKPSSDQIELAFLPSDL